MKRNKWMALLLAAALIISFGSLAVEAKGGYGGFGGQRNASQARLTIEEKEAKVEEYLKLEKITNEEALKIKEQLKACDGTCDGTGPSEDRVRIGQTYGLSFGMNGEGVGRGGRRMGGNAGVCPYVDAN